ncbi:MAG: DoxX family protein [Phycisphaerae bacterium]|nr:DoxX family protein [Phycisphaerae bacterium]
MNGASGSWSREWMNLAILANRLSLGLYFFLAGLGKIRGGVGQFYQGAFAGLRPAWLPDWFAGPYGYALPFLEAAVGVLLIAGFRARPAAGLTLLMLTSFTIALTGAGRFFGSSGPFHANVIFITLAFLLTVTGPGSLSLDAIRSRRGRRATGV